MARNYLTDWNPGNWTTDYGHENLARRAFYEQYGRDASAGDASQINALTRQAEAIAGNGLGGPNSGAVVSALRASAAMKPPPRMVTATEPQSAASRVLNGVGDVWDRREAEIQGRANPYGTSGQAYQTAMAALPRIYANQRRLAEMRRAEQGLTGGLAQASANQLAGYQAGLQGQLAADFAGRAASWDDARDAGLTALAQMRDSSGLAHRQADFNQAQFDWQRSQADLDRQQAGEDRLWNAVYALLNFGGRVAESRAGGAGAPSNFVPFETGTRTRYRTNSDFGA